MLGGGPAKTPVHHVGCLRLGNFYPIPAGDTTWTTTAITSGQRQRRHRCIISVHVGHDERSGSEPDIRPGCPVANTLAFGSLGAKLRSKRLNIFHTYLGAQGRQTTVNRMYVLLFCNERKPSYQHVAHYTPCDPDTQSKLFREHTHAQERAQHCAAHFGLQIQAAKCREDSFSK